MESVLENRELVIKALLGYEYVDGKVVKKHQPIVNVNAVDD